MGFAHPLGVRDRAPSLAEPTARMETAILRRLRQHGYRLIRTPHIERLETLVQDFATTNQTQMFHLVDPERGEPLVLRPDLTPQVARHIAMHPPAEYPVRLAYSGTVFRIDHHNDLSPRERMQIGAELIGWAGPESDSEIMNLAIQSLDDLGLIDNEHSPKVVFAVGSARVLNALIDALDLPDLESRVKVLEAIQLKAYDELVERVGSCGGNKDLAARISGLTGYAADLKQWADEQWPEAVGKEIKTFAENLEGILDKAPTGLIQLDLTEVRDRTYYTGIVFEAFASGSGQPLLAGGRYDRFLSNFGVHQPAAGFALDLDVLAEITSTKTSAGTIHISGEYEYATKLSETIRNLNHNVAFWPNTAGPTNGSWIKTSSENLQWHFEKEDETANGTGSEKDLLLALERWSNGK